MINFFIIEVEENFSMQSIDSIFHVLLLSFRPWVRKALSSTTSGFLSSTKQSSIVMKPVFAVQKLLQPTTGAA